MNIISNSCVGGFLYQNELKSPFQNPFIWSLMDFDSMLYLIKNYYSITYNRFRLQDTGKIEDNTWEFSIIIDGHVKVKYIHYKFLSSAKNLVCKGVNVYSDRIWEYIVNKYRSRLDRMIESNEPPIFILANWFDRPETALSYEQLGILNSLGKCNIICAVDEIVPEYSNIKQILRKDGVHKWQPALAHRIYETFFMPNDVSESN